ncbi:hypothetical protein EKG37_06910 [Robertmurraya yapensis]|uniref:Putative endonuclease Z1 domain-containing protein n=1 Tax=Bacillus yapensis TaxID=2492960 RepID=A0A3S0IY45_9BACI|nr:Z1 domain-containing protein [Bacillus yapensis]RTR33937.1 hypothetical protein EKG37_06910 [Bacillus yapensis]TKS97255.1 hypothetical protein FAR12_06910 [Bacillus yapensis]
MSKIQPIEVDEELESLLSVKLNKGKRWHRKEEALEFIRRLIEAHCFMEGITRDELLKTTPYIEEKLLQNVLESQYITTHEGKCLSSLDAKTLKECKAKIAEMKKMPIWTHWDAYKKHLSINKKFPQQVIDNVDKDTDTILAHLPVPKEVKEFFKIGICMGSVQSGKTMNFAGLTNKLIDIGYDITIILSGMPASLFNQTQKRIEYDVIGLDTLTRKKVGIGLFLPSISDVEIYTKQDTEKESGDFNLAHMRHLPVYHGKKQIVIVTKKNPHMLNAIRTWLSELPLMNEETGKLERLSLALIDDECDNASLNIEKDASKRSSINEKITDILNLFHKRVFIGYSASPFANIYLDPKDKNSLFPNDFMYLLKTPNNYLGAVELFGVTLKNKRIPGLPLVRETDALDSTHFNDGETVHDWDYEHNGVNPSLVVAINSFILSGAIRILRGQGNEHHSMMVHNSVSVKSHEILTKAIQNYIDDVKNMLKGKSTKRFWNSMLELWQKDFVATSQEMEKIDSKHFGETIKYNNHFTFKDIQKAVIQFLSELEDVREINGKSEDKLDFHKTNKKLKVICVGGTILSRGYTIEGLVCSYYMRNSIYYDTVLQAMRFAGYKGNYRDQVRVFTSKVIKQIFEETTKAVYMLSHQLDSMADEEKTPEDFGLFIETKRKSVTKPSAKIRPQNSHKIDPNFSGISKDVAAFVVDDEIIKRNQQITSNFIDTLGEPTKNTKHEITWHAVDTRKIIDFICQFHYSRFGRFRSPLLLKRYLEEVMKHYDSTKTFDVVIPVLSRSGKDSVLLGSSKFKMKSAKRQGELITKEEAGDAMHIVLSGGRALTSRHLVFGLTKEEESELFRKYPLEKGFVHTEHQIREFRKDRGQLVLYAFCKDFINKKSLYSAGAEISHSPIGFHFNLPYCEEFEDREQITNDIYYWNEILGGNVK